MGMDAEPRYDGVGNEKLACKSGQDLARGKRGNNPGTGEPAGMPTDLSGQGGIRWSSRSFAAEAGGEFLSDHGADFHDDGGASDGEPS